MVVRFTAVKKDASAPVYSTGRSAGCDLAACIDADMIVKPGETVKVPTGLAIALPEGFEAQVRPRSGLAAKFGVTVLNSPGTIDSDYRGEVCVLLINLGKQDFTIHNGDRIAQMVVARYEQARFELVDNLNETLRGQGGFGSTGV